MINKESMIAYQYPTIMKDENNLVVTPHELLRHFIANYTFTSPQNMPQQQVVLPSVSSTLVYSIGSNGMTNGLRGVNTKPTVIGGFARQFDFMFLIEFHASGLYPFLKIDQNQLLNRSFSFEELDKSLNQQITEAYYSSNSIRMLTHRIDHIFLSMWDNSTINTSFTFAMQKIIKNKGLVRTKDVASDVYYSEKQLNRLFQKYVGTGVKTFSRIVRMKHAVDLMSSSVDISSVIERMGYYDYSHFIHDFIDIYEITPKEYRSKMSFFYNDPFKL